MDGEIDTEFWRDFFGDWEQPAVYLFNDLL